MLSGERTRAAAVLVCHVAAQPPGRIQVVRDSTRISPTTHRGGHLMAVSGQTTVVLAANSGGSSCERIRIEGNVATTAADVAVWISGGTFLGLAINDNDWSLTADDYMQTGNPTITNQEARGNNGWLDGVVNINAPSLAASATGILSTVTINDARTPDRVFVSSGSDLRGTFVSGAVTAKDTVTIYHFNPTAGAIDVTNSDYRVRVEKFVG